MPQNVPSDRSKGKFTMCYDSDGLRDRDGGDGVAPWSPIATFGAGSLYWEGSAMRLMGFVFGMVLATTLVVTWSVASGAGIGTTLLRLGLCFLVLQVGYALSVGLLAHRERRADRPGHPGRPEPAGVIRPDVVGPTSDDIPS